MEMQRTVVAALLLVACGTTKPSSPDAAPAPDRAPSVDVLRLDAVTPGTDTRPGDGPRADAAKSCVPALGPGQHSFSCDGITFDLMVPATCPASGCGLITDVHGLTMSAKMQDNNTNLRALGAQLGFVVLQPNANPKPPLSSWSASDDKKIRTAMERVIATYKVDPKRVHFTGFSQGGSMSWRFICDHADLLASVAPAAACGAECFTSKFPSRELPILYMHGKKDALVSFACAPKQRDAMLAAWQGKQDSVLAMDGQHVWTRYKTAKGTPIEFLEHDYSAETALIAGHCYPGSKDLKGGELGQLFGFACLPPNAVTWGAAVIKFFLDNPRP